MSDKPISDPWVAEQVERIGYLSDDDLMRTSRVMAALFRTAIRQRPSNDRLRRALTRDAISIAATATGVDL